MSEILCVLHSNHDNILGNGEMLIVGNKHETAFSGMNYYLLSVEDSSNRLIAIHKKSLESST